MQKKSFLLMLLVLSFASCASFSQSRKGESRPKLAQDDKQQLFSYYYYEALRFQLAKEYDNALETFLLCYELDSLQAGLNFDIAVQYQALGSKGATVHYLQKAVNLSPDNWWYSSQLVQVLAELGRSEEAIELALNIQKYHPEKPGAYSMLALLYTQQRELDKAIAIYDKLEGIVGVNEQIALTKYQLLFEADRHDDAVAQIVALVEKNPGELPYQLLLADVYMQQNQNDKALPLYRKVLKQEPENTLAYISLSKYYASVGDYDSLTNLITAALNEDVLPVDAKITVLGQYVEILAAKGKQLDEVDALIKLLIDKYPYEEELHVYYALFLKYQKRDTDHLKQLEQILLINKKNDFAWMELIQESFTREDYSKALQLSLQAIESLPQEPKYYFYKVLALSLLKEYKAALAGCETLLELLKNSNNLEFKSTVYAQMGDLYYKLNDKEKSFESYKEALLFNPNDISLMNNYAYYLSESEQDLKYAESLSIKTLDKEPNNSTFLDTYAWILYQQGNYSLARLYIERAVENSKEQEESAVILDHYADILWMLGEKEKAVEIWKKALTRATDSKDLKEVIEAKIRNKAIVNK